MTLINELGFARDHADQHAMKQTVAVFLSLNLLTSPTLAEGGMPRWELDNRRCRVIADYDGNALIIANDEGELQIEVPRVEEEILDSEGEHLYAQIDGGMKIKLEPLRIDNVSVGGYRLGKHEELAPIISRGKQLYVGGGTPGGWSQTFDLTGSRKAMKFLKKCQRFWERWHQKRK